MSGGGLDVEGASFPGAPAVIIGHNQRIAWGVTNVGPDVQDLFIERMNPQNPRQYQFQGQWVDAQVVNEEIKVKGAASIKLEVLVTRHGPVVTPVLKGVTETLALRWTALDPGTLFRSVRLLDQATNWNEFRAALSYLGRAVAELRLRGRGRQHRLPDAGAHSDPRQGQRVRARAWLQRRVRVDQLHPL